MKLDPGRRPPVQYGDPSFLQFLIQALRQRTLQPEPPQQVPLAPNPPQGGVRG